MGMETGDYTQIERPLQMISQCLDQHQEMSPWARPVGAPGGQGSVGRVHPRDSSGADGKNDVITPHHTKRRTGMSMNTALQNVRANAERVLPCAVERWLCQFPAATSA